MANYVVASDLWERGNPPRTKNVIASRPTLAVRRSNLTRREEIPSKLFF